jgi:hypothetical protein
MDNVITIAFLTTGFFSVLKFFELRCLDRPEEMKGLKYFVRDTLFVFIASLLASMLYFHIHPSLAEFFNVITETKTVFPSAAKTEIFTDTPAF